MALDVHIEPATGVDLSERGRSPDGDSIRLDRRLFMQLSVFSGCRSTPDVIDAVQSANVEAIVYEQADDPQGVAVLTMSEDPEHFVGPARAVLSAPPFSSLAAKPDLTMFGRTYAIGYESDLEDTLLRRPRRTVGNPDWDWAIWYPVRRSGGFTKLPRDEQRTILMEHGGIGRAYGRADLAHDVRLACHGLNAQDNDFIIGLVGKALFPLSAIVERMRVTRQTSEFLTQLGPFFVGRAAWRSATLETACESGPGSEHEAATS